MLIPILLYILFFLTGAWFIYKLPKGQATLFLNRNRKPFLDYFFRYYTNLGDGINYIILAATTIIFDYYSLYPILEIFILQTILVQLLKRGFFKGAARPKRFFKMQGHKLNLVEGIKTYGYNTFPSGHTATAFSLATQLIIVLELQWLAFIPFVLAILIGTSRVYLLQHFFEDAYAGALIGVISVVSVLFYFQHVIPIEQYFPFEQYIKSFFGLS